MYFPPPAEPLSDGVVTLRLPSVEAGDVEAVLSYVEEDQLNGGWLPEVPPLSAERVVREWLGASARRRQPDVCGYHPGGAPVHRRRRVR
jgi:hypothetical protein